MTVNATGFKGVYKKRNRFAAMGYVDRKCVHLGHFDTPELASEAYKKWVASNKSTVGCRRLTDYYQNDKLDARLVGIVEGVLNGLINAKNP